MKMKLFAAAVAALAAGGAYAQSSVTLYGVVDAGIEYQNHQPGGGHDVVRMTSGNLSGSRWGLRGVEDLGGGLKGVFVLESGFNVDNGTTGQTSNNTSRLFGRQAYVGLQSQWGALTLGRQQTPFYEFGLAFDPMAISTKYSITSQDSAFSQRADNSIKYVGTFGGLTANALYSFGWDNNGEVAGTAKIGREYSASLTYVGGPFSVGAVYDETNVATSVATKDQILRRASVAGTYAFGPAKVFAGYRWGHAVDTIFLTTPAPGGKNTSNLYWLGLGYQLTPALSLTGATYYQDFRSSGRDPWTFVASADYAFSKRTDAYLTVSYAKNKDDSTMGVDGFGKTNGTNNQFGAVVGVRHKF